MHRSDTGDIRETTRRAANKRAAIGKVGDNQDKHGNNDGEN